MATFAIALPTSCHILVAAIKISKVKLIPIYGTLHYCLSLQFQAKSYIDTM